MNKFLLIFIGLIICCEVRAQNIDQHCGMTEQDYRTLEKAIMLVDGGMTAAALGDFNDLAKRYPDNYLVLYERLYALYMLGQYSEVANDAIDLLNRPEAQYVAFQLCGNACDMTGNSTEARRIYQLGLDRFPNSGSLYLELGNLDWAEERYMAALPYYLQGIKVDPNFASNYFRAAIISFAIDEAKVWGLIYAETEILLAPNNEERHNYMAQTIRDCYTESIESKANGSKLETSINLVPARNIQIDPEQEMVLVEFPGVYEACAITALTKYFSVPDKMFNGSIADMAELRKGIVEAYMKAAADAFGNAMYLLPFQKLIIDAGHWEAYNYFLLGPAAPEEFSTWYEVNGSKLDSFIEWYNLDDNRFSLGDGKSVGQLDIFSDYKRMELMKAFELQTDINETEPSL